MSRKALLIIDQDAMVKDLCEQIRGVKKRAAERVKFIEKQMDDAIAAHNKEIKPMWDEITEHCKALGLLPYDYSDQKYCLGFGEDGVLMIETKDDEGNSLSDILTRLLKR
jgi:hypothetical protein